MPMIGYMDLSYRSNADVLITKLVRLYPVMGLTREEQPKCSHCNTHGDYLGPVTRIRSHRLRYCVRHALIFWAEERRIHLARRRQSRDKPAVPVKHRHSRDSFLVGAGFNRTAPLILEADDGT